MFACILLTIFLSLLYYYRRIYKFNKKIENYPLPPEWPILGHALDFINASHLNVLLSYQSKYGDTVRIKTGPRRQILFTSNHHLIEFVLSSTKILDKSLDYKNLNRWLGTGLLTGTGPKWKRNRQQLTPAFHLDILKDFVPVYDRNTNILCNIFQQTNGEEVNVHGYLLKCMLDIICETAMGTKVHAQTEPESEYLRSCNVMCQIIIERAFSPHKMFDSIYYFTNDYKRETKALEILHDYTKKVIRQKQNETSSSNKRKAFLDLLLDSNLTFDELCEEVDTFMFAGHHTTSTALSFALYSIAQDPTIQNAILQEQTNLFTTFDEPITIKELKLMRYLEDVIKESLRLYPSVPFYARELKEDVEYNNGVLPQGLTITMFPFGLHRNEAYFPNAEKFDPSRWIDPKVPFSYLPFSAGPRNCIGQKFAMNVMKTVIAKVVQRFELVPIKGHKLELAAEIVLTSKTGFNMRFKKRV